MIPNRPPGQPLAFLAIDAESNETDVDTGLLGTDFMFFTAFFGNYKKIRNKILHFKMVVNIFNGWN